MEFFFSFVEMQHLIWDNKWLIPEVFFVIAAIFSSKPCFSDMSVEF